MEVRLQLLLIFKISTSYTQSFYPVLSCALGKAMNIQLPETQDHSIVKGFGPVKENVFFYLYTSESPDRHKIILNDVESLKSSTFVYSRPTKIITHGYINSGESDACGQPKDALLHNGNYNIIVVDWWEMQSVWGIPLLYGSVCNYVSLVGEHVAKMIDFLGEQGMNLKTTTLIGHSLGAHVMGIAGFHSRNKVNYIIGLDPALPNFETRKVGERLSSEDANTVLVIHTNIGDCGISEAIGHYDFYPNGGAKQPGCQTNRCSHSRVYEIYAESINSETGFYGKLCADFDEIIEGNCTGDMVKMNENMREQNAKEGMYYFKTSDTFPYALENSQLTF